MTDDRSPRLDWSPEGEPRSGRFGDVYFSREDGLAETRAVFLDGCGLPEAWQDRDRFTVAELGFGTGLNIVALLDLWRRTRLTHGRLHVFTIEGFPLTRDEAARALSGWPEVAEAAQALLDRWPEGTPGFHRIDLPDWGVVIDLAVGDAAWALEQWTGRADAWFLDGFAPSTNPGMWSDAVLDSIAARSAPGARVATFTVAGAVRRGLQARGYTVEKKPGHGRKRERLEATAPGAAAVIAAPDRVGIIGAGIAGASLVRALNALNIRPLLFEAEGPGAGGSGFPASLVTPRLDAGDADVAALGAQALVRASRLYADIPGAVLAQGVVQLAAQPRDARRFDKVAEQDIWRPGAMTVQDGADGPCLVMADAMALHPRTVLDAWLAGAELIQATVARIERHANSWRLFTADDAMVGEVDRLILAGGWGNAALAPHLGLAPVRGQAEWAEGVTTTPLAWGGYAVPTPDGLLFGATHDRGRTDTDHLPADQERNLQTLRQRRPELADAAVASDLQGRAAIRATTPDRMPLAGAIPGEPGLMVLGGMGSRGFCWSPLLAEHVAALIADAPSPLPHALAVRVAPGRFMQHSASSAP